MEGACSCKKIKKSYLYIDGTNLFAGQNVKDVLLGSCNEVVIMTGDADFIYPIELVKQFNVKTGAIFLSNRFSLEMAYKVNKAYVFNFLGKFKINRKLPRQLKIFKKSPVCKHTG